MRILALLLGNAAILLAAHAVLRRVRTGEASTDTLIYLLLRLALISLAVLAAGATQTLTPTGLGAGSAVVLALLLALGEHRHLPRCRLPDVGRGALLVAGAIVLRSLLQVWFFAPFQRDALTYHLPKIGEWIQHGGFTGEWGLDLRSTFPSGFELIEAWWVVFLRHDVLIEMAGLEFLLLGSAAIVDLARRLGAAPRLAFLGGLLWALTPGICLQATSCLNDGPAAALWTATAALVLRSVPLTLLLLPFGLGIGVKPTYAYALPGLALLWVFTARRREPQTPWTIGVGAAALITGLSWYIRNAVVYGNPIHPMGPSGIAPHPDYVAQRFGPSATTMVENLVRAADSRIYDNLGPPDPELTFISGWGIAALSVGLVSLFLAVRRDPLMRWVAGGYAVSLLSVFALVVSDPWYMRYVLFFPGLFALAVAKAAETSRAVLLVAWAALGVQFVATMIPGKFPIGALTDLASMSWKERAFYGRADLEPLEAIGFLERPHDEVKMYVLYRPDFSRRVVNLRPVTADDLLNLLRHENLRYLFSPKLHPLAQECLDSGRLVKVGAGLFRVP